MIGLQSTPTLAPFSQRGIQYRHMVAFTQPFPTSISGNYESVSWHLRRPPDGNVHLLEMPRLLLVKLHMSSGIAPAIILFRQSSIKRLQFIDGKLRLATLLDNVSQRSG